MIIDCHGHYTTAPAPHNDWREAQKAAFKAGEVPPLYPTLSDDEIRETLEKNQLRLLRERGADMTIFSPRASAMAHHVGDEAVSTAWARHNNDLIKRCVDLYPDVFIGVGMLPQSPGVPIENSIAELERCVNELGFVGCNLNPDPSGGHFSAPPLIDRSWYPFYEKMVELDVPAMVHVSGSCNPVFHATGAYYISADTTAFMQFIQGDLFGDFPELRFIIPHGGGAVPYHWGRYRGLADMLKQPPLDGHVMKNVWFDAAVVVRPNSTPDQLERIAARIRQIGVKRILYGSDAASSPLAYPKAGWAALQRLPLTNTELVVMANNIAPYMRDFAVR